MSNLIYIEPETGNLHLKTGISNNQYTEYGFNTDGSAGYKQFNSDGTDHDDYDGVQIQKKIFTKNYTATYSVNANAKTHVEIPISENGYQPLGLIGVASGRQGVLFCEAITGSSTISIYFQNTNSSNVTNATVTARVLFQHA